MSVTSNYFFVIHPQTRLNIGGILTEAPGERELARRAKLAGLQVQDLIVHSQSQAGLQQSNQTRITWFLPQGDNPVIRPATAGEADSAKAVGSRYVDRVKAEAGRRIEDVVPDWKQRNLLARSSEFLLKGIPNLTSNEHTELTRILALWAWVKSVRAFSDTLETQSPDTDISAAAWPVWTES
jgi:hypothetical protein